MASELASEESTPSNGLAEQHKGRRHSKNKKSDPFLQLQDDVKLPDLQPSPTDEKDGNGAHRSPSLLTDLVFTPLAAIATILSLFLVDRKQRQWRSSQHPLGSQADSFWSRFTRWPRLDPEPYQIQNTTRQHCNSSARQTAGDSSFQGWYTRKKHRAMARVTLSDALDMRGRIIVALLAWTVLSVFVIAYSMRRLYIWLSV